jgi:uncharacterized protein
MADNFEWDEEKAIKNFSKHGVSFDEASTVFADPFCVTLDDTLHSTEEYRFLAIGYSIVQRLLLVVYTERGYYNIRIISARIATRGEKRIYEQGI